MEDRWLSVDEIADHLGIKRDTVTFSLSLSFNASTSAKNNSVIAVQIQKISK